MQPNSCGDVAISGPERLQAAAFGAVARPPPILVAVGLTPLAGGGYAPASIVLWLESTYYETLSATGSTTVLETLDSSRLTWQAVARASRQAGLVASCLAEALESMIGARLARPWAEPRVVLPVEAVVVSPRGYSAPQTPGAAVAALWLRWFESRAQACRGPDCPLAPLLSALRGFDWERLEAEARIALLESHSIFPLTAASGGEAGRVAVPGEGVGPAQYYRLAFQAGAEPLLPAPQGRPPEPVGQAMLALGARLAPRARPRHHGRRGSLA